MWRKQDKANCVNERTPNPKPTVQRSRYLFGGRDEAADFAEVHGVGASVVALLCERQGCLQAGVGLMQSDRRAGRPDQRPVEVLTQPEHKAQAGQDQPRD